MKEDYNDRLFSNGLRKWLHLARFYWLKNKLNKFSPSYDYVVELGCFDGRSLRYLPKKPKKYIGFDANWEGGLETANENNNINEYYFIECTTHKDFKIENNSKATIFICMETLEHLCDYDLNGYLEQIKKILCGYMFVTIPNEKGLLFLIKYLIKIFVFKDPNNYTINEVFASLMGDMKKVERNDHKGFDWEEMIRILGGMFDILEVEGVQFKYLPKYFNAQIGIVLKSR
jgi:hypothetical protein